MYIIEIYEIYNFHYEKTNGNVNRMILCVPCFHLNQVHKYFASQCIYKAPNLPKGLCIRIETYSFLCLSFHVVVKFF